MGSKRHVAGGWMVTETGDTEERFEPDPPPPGSEGTEGETAPAGETKTKKVRRKDREVGK